MRRGVPPPPPCSRGCCGLGPWAQAGGQSHGSRRCPGAESPSPEGLFTDWREGTDRRVKHPSVASHTPPTVTYFQGWAWTPCPGTRGSFHSERKPPAGRVAHFPLESGKRPRVLPQGGAPMNGRLWVSEPLGVAVCRGPSQATSGSAVPPPSGITQVSHIKAPTFYLFQVKTSSLLR